MRQVTSISPSLSPRTHCLRLVLYSNFEIRLSKGRMPSIVDQRTGRTIRDIALFVRATRYSVPLLSLSETRSSFEIWRLGPCQERRPRYSDGVTRKVCSMRSTSSGILNTASISTYTSGRVGLIVVVDVNERALGNIRVRTSTPTLKFTAGLYPQVLAARQSLCHCKRKSPAH
jgi:hypothetical protein